MLNRHVVWWLHINRGMGPGASWLDNFPCHTERPAACLAMAIGISDVPMPAMVDYLKNYPSPIESYGLIPPFPINFPIGLRSPHSTKPWQMSSAKLASPGNRPQKKVRETNKDNPFISQTKAIYLVCVYIYYIYTHTMYPRIRICLTMVCSVFSMVCDFLKPIE